VDSGDQLPVVEGFDHVVLGSGLDAIHSAGDVRRLPGEQYDGDEEKREGGEPEQAGEQRAFLEDVSVVKIRESREGVEAVGLAGERVQQQRKREPVHDEHEKEIRGGDGMTGLE